jgi:hypothetical protein
MSTIVLCKYRPINQNTERILSHTELWFSAPSTFNDLHECCFVHPTNIMSDAEIDRQRNWWRICCFAGVHDDLLMWSHYADHHRGICLGFSVEEKDIYDAASGNTSGKFYRVSYPDDDMIPSVRGGANNNEAVTDFVTRVLCSKSRHWRYEREVRMLSHPSWPDMMKYTTTGVSIEFPPPFLTHVYLGARIAQSDQNKVIKLLLNRPNSVKLFKAHRHPLKYELVFDHLAARGSIPSRQSA